MKIPYGWLAEWVPVPWPARELGARLTMAGFELESLERAAPEFSNVIVAEILSAEPHPQADKLQVCRVSTGSGAVLQIVCGAPNARAGLKSALAEVGARLPGDITLKAATLRGVESRACSPRPGSSGSRKVPAAYSSCPLRHPWGSPCASTSILMSRCSI